MAQGNRRDEKMRSDRGEWDRKRTGSGNTDKRKKKVVKQQLKNDKDIKITLKDGKVSGHFILEK